MSKASQSEFRFKRTDTIGAASAEDDTKFLDDCFVTTGEYEVLKDIKDIHQIVLGRTGSGKSALFEKLKSEMRQHVISIEPHELALTYVSNSSVIQYFSSLGVNLDPFYKLLWRHVLTVEILRTHFASHAKEEAGGLWDYLLDLFSSKRSGGKDAEMAVNYLKTWGERFWVETEYRVKDITEKMEKDLTSQLDSELRAHVVSGKAGSGSRLSLSNETKTEVIRRSQRIVSEAQVQDLSKVQQLLGTALEDKQQFYYILIDRLDEDWVEEDLRYRLIVTLLETAKELSNVAHIKVLVAIRRDLLDRVFRRIRATRSGFQEEKYQSIYLPLHWSPEMLIDVLDKRVNALVVSRYQKKRVRYQDLMPKRIDGQSMQDFITSRATRPRDIISWFNKCIEMADGRTKVTLDALRRAEGEYSRQRMKALGDEWNATYPGLLDFVRVLKQRPRTFPLSDVDLVLLDDLCLESAMYQSGDSGALRKGAMRVAEKHMQVDDFRRTLFMIFYRVGLVGLKLEAFQSASWVDEKGQSVSSSEIEDSTAVAVHPTYWRALGIETRPRGRGRG